jgi:mannose-6-phosphate isomerase-like protein (cupin superfamily)
MRTVKVAVVMAMAALASLGVRAQQRESLVWAPVPTTPNGWVAPNKLHTKVSDLIAAHQQQPNWREAVVRDNLLEADYVQMAPGMKSPRQFHPDNPIWWIVQSGELRFTIDGQEPFVAGKSFLVQVPYRNVFQMEVVGSAPALFLEVRVAGSPAMYPLDETPVPVPGMEFVRVRISGRANYSETVRPFLDFNGRVAAGERVAGAFVSDARAFANIIRGRPQVRNPRDKGHFHEVSAEFWFILEGTINYRVADFPIFDAQQGDIVYVPKQAWHSALHGGTDFSTRVAMNGYPQLLHNFQPLEELK